MAVQPSPAVMRAARVLKLLAAEPAGELSLAELARRLGAHRSSCQTVVLALCGEGLVSRNEGAAGPTYRLGPAVLELADAARPAVHAIDLVDTALVRLGDRFGVTAMAGQVRGDAIIVVTAHPVPHPFGFTIATGTRIPLRAPIGSVYVAWESDAAIDAWCDRAATRLSRRERLEFRRELAMIRDRGWSATVRAHDSDAGREANPNDLRRRSLSVTGISAPVWDDRGALMCSIALAAFPDALSGTEICRIADDVKIEANEVTAAIGGHPR